MTTDSLGITTGAWWVAATGGVTGSRIIAVRNTGEQATTSLIKFPAG